MNILEQVYGKKEKDAERGVMMPRETDQHLAILLSPTDLALTRERFGERGEYREEGGGQREREG